jgi:hypothetical protein
MVMGCEVGRFFAKGWIALHWLEPQFLFKYYRFSWVHPWPGNWLYVHWAVLGVCALFVAAGCLYRVSTVLLFLSYTYFFLLEEARFVNHTYLICLFSFLLIFVPAHRALSIDAWLRPEIRSEVTPAWTLWLLRAQMGVVYFYGGVAKLAPDWLHGEPMRMRMSANNDFPILGRFFREEWAVYGASYGSLLFDLFIVPCLLWRRTRIAAFCAVLTFHLINARWFSIGIFPWLAISATALFLSPSWPRKIIGLFRSARPMPAPLDWKLPSPRKQFVVLNFVAIYLAIQFLVPLRHFLSPGGIEWNHMEHRFSWRMMLVRHESNAFFYVTDTNNGRTYQVTPEEFLNSRQRSALTFMPDLPLQFAHYLATVMPRKGPKPLKVEARISLSVNGRKPELFLDPNVDLAAEPRTLGRPRWLLPIHEPLRRREEEFPEGVFAPNE